MRLGIMQGRLSSPPGHRLQAFPWDHWEAEFALARECGIDAIEWLFEIERFDENPIWTERGIEQILARIEETGTKVMSVCADYLMARPLFVPDGADQRESEAALCRLIAQSARIGVQRILIPVLEVSELRTPADRERLIASLGRVAPIAEAHAVRLGLETELVADDYLSLVRSAAHPMIGAYYDTGNAAARGYDVADDVRTLAPVLCGVHVKDRVRGGPSVPLGNGAVDFVALFRALSDVRYDGPLVLQPAFGADYVSFARRHVSFVRDHVDSVDGARLGHAQADQ